MKSIITFRMKLICLILNFLVISAFASSEEGSLDDVTENYRFTIKIGNIDVGQIISVGGLGVNAVIKEHVDENSNRTLLRFDRIKFGNITLKKKFSADSTFNEWIERLRSGNIDHYRKDIIITLIGQSIQLNSSVIKRWKLYDCIPRSWNLSPLNMSGKSTLTEQLVVSCEWMEEDSNL